jgi:copper(I)-binding protein
MRGANRLAVAVVMLGMLAGAPFSAGQQRDLSTAKGWIGMPAKGEAMATAGAVVENTTAYIVYLTSASTDIAGRVELRDARKGSQPVKFIAVPAYGSVVMDPKGLHLVLGDLKRALKQGETVSLTLKTDQGVNLPVSAVVRR